MGKILEYRSVRNVLESKGKRVWKKESISWYIFSSHHNKSIILNDYNYRMNDS